MGVGLWSAREGHAPTRPATGAADPRAARLHRRVEGRRRDALAVDDARAPRGRERHACGAAGGERAGARGRRSRSAKAPRLTRAATTHSARSRGARKPRARAHFLSYFPLILLTPPRAPTVQQLDGQRRPGAGRERQQCVGAHARRHEQRRHVHHQRHGDARQQRRLELERRGLSEDRELRGSGDRGRPGGGEVSRSLRTRARARGRASACLFCVTSVSVCVNVCVGV